MKVIKWLDDHFEEFLLVIALILITVVCFTQAVIRKLPDVIIFFGFGSESVANFAHSIKPFPWADEFSRFAWIWSVFLSLPYTIKRCSMLRVTVVLDALPEKARKVFNIFVDVVNVALMLFFLYYCFFGKNAVIIKQFTKIELSPAMEMPMWGVYLALSVGFFLGAIRGIQVLVEHIRNFNVHQLTALEQTIADAAEEVAAAKGAEGIADEPEAVKEA